MRILATLFLGLATALASLAQAQDFPSRVGRIAHIEGRASLYQDPEGGWELAYVNSPITSENSVWTDEGSRAEVRVSGMAIRLDHLTQLDVARLDEDELNAFIARGTVAVRVRHYENNERLVFSTPNARVRLRANGRYRIDVDPDRLETRITVFAGEARVGTEDGRMSIPAGRSMLVFGASPPEYVDERMLTSAFDRWTVARDERWREGRATTYVSTHMTGYEDLDTYGTWATEPDYGTLWYPRNVSANWAPYRDGRWDYVRPWGWTWVDDAPWGYAPFHYGRWVYVRNRWAWHPGERVARPTWAPALVAFVGGSNFNFSISSGGTPVGWYPLSPWDRYDPWFQASPTYVNRVNVHVRNAPTRQDRRDWQRYTRERGTTVVDRRTMLEQRSVRQAVLPVSADVIRQVQAAPQPSAVLPTRNDVLQRRRQQPQQAPAPMVVAQPAAPVQPGAPAQPRSERSTIARPDFGRNANAVVATPRRASAPPPERGAPSPLARDAQKTQERQARDAQQAQQQQAREAQKAQEQQAQQQQQAQQRAQREQQQALERQNKERAQQQQQAKEREAQGKAQQQQQAQERAQREQQQALERQNKERAQQQQQAKEREAQGKAQQQQQAQERAQREQQQALERQNKERAQQQQQAKEREAQGKAQQQQQAQERAQREQQQALERQNKERAQQQQQAKEREAQGKAQQQQQAQERAQREQQQALERQNKERAQQQQQQQAKERDSQRQAQQQQQAQAQERAQREQQQAQARAQQQAQEQAKAQAAQQAKAQAAQQAQAQAAQQAQAQAAQQAKAAEQAAKGKGRDDRQREEEEEEKEKGKGKNR